MSASLPSASPLAQMAPVASSPTLWHRAITPVLTYFRRRRAQAIRQAAGGLSGARVLDFGGSVHFWFESGLASEVQQVLICNLSTDEVDVAGQADGRFQFLGFDGLHLPLADQSYDLVVCNSVIEHVPLALRAQVVAEMRRVAKHGFLQTPAKEFPIEPHFVMPGLHWLPRRWARHAVAWTPWALLSRPTPAHQQAYFEEVQLLSRRGVQDLFPDCTVQAERFLGWPKSWLVRW